MNTAKPSKLFTESECQHIAVMAAGRSISPPAQKPASVPGGSGAGLVGNPSNPPNYPVGEVLVFRSVVHQSHFFTSLNRLIAQTEPLNSHLLGNIAAASVVHTECFLPTSLTPSVRRQSVMNPITAFQRRRSA